MKKEIKAPRPSRKLQQLQFAAHSASRVAVIVHLSNGTKLNGIVLASDNYMILLGRNAEDPTPTLIHKRAITVVTPAHAPEETVAMVDAQASPGFVRIFIPRTRKRR
ncbi:RNA chaperone Hfq [Cupriavidus pauculus]|uniref:RNA chaperone Hfq n=1 Tax=Cupriavidus pauculus TaxID=82633 RepID=UPI0007802AE9|nr:RNA chaperone Hfq [Cupriavidus pauculus]MBY4730216.1 RNA chaperone Hfq [Cupriavidus pauculus]